MSDSFTERIKVISEWVVKDGEQFRLVDKGAGPRELQHADAGEMFHPERECYVHGVLCHRIEQLEAELAEAKEQLNQSEIDNLGHGYALEELNVRMGLPRENESYLRVLEEYQSIYNRCQQSEILQRESEAENAEFKRQIAAGELVSVDVLGSYSIHVIEFMQGLRDHLKQPLEFAAEQARKDAQ